MESPSRIAGRAPLAILMRRRNSPGYEYVDTVYFNPYNGEYISTWRYGVNQSLGDWIIWSQVPLHFGTYWGLGVKIVWAVVRPGHPAAHSNRAADVLESRAAKKMEAAGEKQSGAGSRPSRVSHNLVRFCARFVIG